MNKISIIIPVYNVEKYLSACIESIIGQTYQNLEIILIDDGSTDSCAEICDQYAAKDSRIKVLHKENGGLSDARNAGYELVTGDYLSFVDGDDMVSGDFYSDLIKTATGYDADIVECEFVRFKDEKELQHLHYESSLQEFTAEKALAFLLKEQLNQVVWNKLYKTATVDNLFFEKGKIHEDEFWTYKIFARAKKIVKISHPLYFYRQQNESIMAEKYSVKRLSGMDAREERMHFITENFPSLTALAVRTFWYSAFNNYQAIARTSGIDADRTLRKKIVTKVKDSVRSEHYGGWSLKDRFWMLFFLAVPDFCCRIRNFAGVGI